MGAFRIVPFLAMLGTGAAAAAPVFPGVSTVGLEPLPSMEAGSSGLFVYGEASILVQGVPPNDHATDADRAKIAAQSIGRGAKIAAFSAGRNRGFIVRGRTTMDKVKYRTWVVLLSSGKQSGRVSANVPVADTQVTDAAIEATLKTIAFRPTPGLEAQMEELRFEVVDLAGFRAARASAEKETLELADAGAPSPGTLSHVLIHPDSLFFPTSEAQGRQLAERFLWARYRVKPLSSVEPRFYPGGAGHYVELRAKKMDAASRTITDIIFLVRYDASGAFEIACTSPHPVAAPFVERCRTVALSVRPKG